MINTEMKGSRVLECLQKEVSYGISRDLIFTQAICMKTVPSWNDRMFHHGNIYLFTPNNRNNGKKHEICSKLTLKTPECFPVFLLFILSMY